MREPTVFGAILRAATQPSEVIAAEVDEELNQMVEGDR